VHYAIVWVFAAVLIAIVGAAVFVAYAIRYLHVLQQQAHGLLRYLCPLLLLIATTFRAARLVPVYRQIVNASDYRKPLVTL